MSREHVAALIPHPSTPMMVVRSLSARVRADGPGRLTLQYRLQAELARLRVPAAGGGERLDGLWKHTCFEAFVAVAGATAYREFNFSPSGDWAAYEFSAYRQGMAPARLKSLPQIEVTQGKSRMQVDVQVAWPVYDPQEILRVGLTAVIEAEDGSVSYWAAKHAPGKQPDFHHPDSLALEVAL
jgi:hypothetical protein